MNQSKLVRNVAKGAGIAALAVAIASPALAFNPNFAALLASIKADQPQLEPTGRFVILDRSDFFTLLDRDDPRSPN